MAIKRTESFRSYHRFGKLNAFKCRVDSLINSSKEDERFLKAIFGIISGIIIGILIFLVYRYSFGYTFTEAVILTGILTALICTGLALSSFIRCITALVVPNLFTGIGRTVLLSAIFALILEFPISNISHNAKAAGGSMACVLGIAINQTKALQLEMSIPSDDLRNYVRKQNEERKALVDKLESAFGILTQTLDLLDDGSATTESVKCSLQKVIT
jgi:hypothetical protein